MSERFDLKYDGLYYIQFHYIKLQLFVAQHLLNYTKEKVFANNEYFHSSKRSHKEKKKRVFYPFYTSSIFKILKISLSNVHGTSSSQTQQSKHLILNSSMKNQYSGQVIHVNEKLRNFISGLVAGVISVTVCNPLDIARTRLNVLNAPSHHSDHPKYTHFTQAMRTIWKDQGWRGFYSGYRTNVIAIPIFHSIFFPLYQNTKKMSQQAGYNKSESYLTATLLAGGVCNIITNPIWVVRTRLMAQYLQNKQNQYQTNNPFSFMKQMYQQEGVRSLFMGVTVSFFTITNAIIYFQLYQKLKQLLGKSKKPTVSEIFISSTLSKIMASIVTYPFIVIRTVMYDQRGKSNGSILNIVKYIYRQSGMVGFYAGLKPDLIRLIPSNAITFIVYQKMKMFL